MAATKVTAETKSRTAQAAQGLNERSHRPARHDNDASNELIAAILGRPSRFEIVLKDYLMRLLIEGLTGKPGAVPLRPMLAGLIDSAMPQQEGQQLLARPHELHRGIQPCPRQIAHGFVRLIWNPDAGEVAGSMQHRELLGIPAVCLDALARLARDHRGGHNGAAMAEIGEMAIDAVPTAPRLVAELQQAPSFSKVDAARIARIGNALALSRQDDCPRAGTNHDACERQAARRYRCPQALIRAERAAHAAVVAERNAISAERDTLTARNARLEAIIQEIRRAHFGRKSERITDDQLAFALEELETSLAKAERRTRRPIRRSRPSARASAGPAAATASIICRMRRW
jgi:hypothetical protein